MEIVSFQPLERGTLIGFADVGVAGIVIHSVGIHRRGSSRWASMPGRPMLDRDRQLMHDEDGKIRYAKAISIPDRKTRDRFTAAALEALDAYLARGGKS